MYEAHFGLSKRPFASVARVDQYYPAAAIEAARETLARCIRRAEGAGMVVGSSGTGKTLLCQMLAEQFKESFAVVTLASGRLSTRRALLQAILFGMGLPYRGMDEGELRLAMVDHLTLGEDSQRGMVLLVDEAHTLPLRLLEEIRMITNLVSGGQPRTRLVLAGGSILEERFASPRLDSFNQRIVARCYLESLNREETQSYIHAQIGWAGREAEEVISSDACHAVYQATDGIPRLINQVCDHALLLACVGRRARVDRAAIEEAWGDLQQLPPPWSGEAPEAKPTAGIIEFGRLEDQPDGSEHAPAAMGQTGHEKPLLPMLRISPESDEPTPDPAEQVEQTGRIPSGADEEFQPAGSIGSELDLMFDEPEDPFSEPFEEEEVIVGRCEPAPPSDTAIEPQSGAVEVPEAAEAAELSETQSAPADDDLEATEISEEMAEEISLAGVVPEQEPAAEESLEAAFGNGEDAESQGDAEPETLPIHRAEAAELMEPEEGTEPEEDPVIIVEEGYDEPHRVPGRPAAGARRLEYRQLFARLRRSC